MRLICYWQQRQLARQIVGGEPISPTPFLAAHLARCAVCAQAYQELICLNSEVLVALPPAELSPEFEARLRSKLRAAASSVPERHSLRAFPLPLRFVLAGTAILALGMYLMQKEPQRGGTGSTVSVSGPRKKHAPDTLPDKSDRDARILAGLSGKSHQRSAPIRPDSHFPHPANLSRAVRFGLRRQAPHRRSRPWLVTRHLYATTGPSARRRLPGELPRSHQEVSSVLQVVYATATWQEAGEVYEAYGDHGRAAHAYGCALTQQPSAELAIAASDNAAQTGDTCESLEYLARALATGANDDDSTPASGTDTDTKVSNL